MARKLVMMMAMVVVVVVVVVAGTITVMTTLGRLTDSSRGQHAGRNGGDEWTTRQMKVAAAAALL